MKSMRSDIRPKGAGSGSVAATAWVLAFALAILATQIGGLEREFVSNESTFTVIAAHVLDGNLPFPWGGAFAPCGP